MTTQEIGHDPVAAPLTGGRLGDLLDRSPADPAATAAAAVLGFVLGLATLGTAPFALTYGLCVVLGGLCVVSCVVGLAQASRSATAGSSLAAAGLVLGLLGLGLLSLRFAGLDTAFGDTYLPQLRSALEALTALIPAP